MWAATGRAPDGQRTDIFVAPLWQQRPRDHRDVLDIAIEKCVDIRVGLLDANQAAGRASWRQLLAARAPARAAGGAGGRTLRSPASTSSSPPFFLSFLPIAARLRLNQLGDSRS